MKQRALSLAREGFKVFPIAAGAKSPPLLNGWPAKATTDEAMIELFWLPVPDANIGIHCEGLLVLDVDPGKGGNESLDKLRLLDDLPATRCATTPSGGSHHYYRLPAAHVGVANTVGRLGAGLDIRSTGGYCVAAGSVTPAGAYEWVDAAVPVAPAPAWLVERLGAATHAADAAPRADVVVDAAESVVRRAREWLAVQPVAVEGQGGDMRTYAVACGLRDLGVSKAQSAELLGVWNARCEPPWSDDELAAKVANAYRYAENEAGSKAAAPEDFPVVENSTFAVRKQHTPSALRTLEELAGDATPSAGYVIKGLLQRASYAEAYGAPGAGKTFVALDWAYHVAAALPWMSKKVHAGCVLYLAYEGQGGLKKRAQALRQKYGTKAAPLYVVGATFNLRDKPGRAALGETMALLPEKPVLIVIDTFARALMGGDENSAQDVGAFNSAVGALIESTGACVLILHHSGKDKSKGARGSSALLGALDTEIEIDSGQIIARKQRDVDLGEAIGFKLVPVMVGIDEDGDDVTSCVVEPSAVQAAPGRLTGNAKRGWEVLCGMSENNAAVSPHEWRDLCKEFLGAKGLSQRFYDIKKSLAAKGYIEEDANGWIKRRMT